MSSARRPALRRWSPAPHWRCAASAAAPSAPSGRRPDGGSRAPQQPAQDLRRKPTARSTWSRRVREAAQSASGRARQRRASASAGRSRGSRNGVQRRVLTGLWSGAHLDGTQAEGPGRRSAPERRVLRPAAGRGDRRRTASTRSGPTPRRRATSSRRRPGRAAPVVIVQSGRVRGREQPRPRRRAGREAGQPADRQRPVRVRPVSRRLRGRRRGGERPALDQPGRQDLGARRVPDADRAAHEGGRAADRRAGDDDLDPGPGRAEQRGRRPRRRALRRRADRRAVQAGNGARLAGRAGKEDAPSTLRGSRTSRISRSTGKDLLVLEMATKGLYGPRSPGALIRARTERHRARCSRAPGSSTRRACDRQRLDLHLEPRPVPGIRRRAARRAGAARATPRLIRGRRLRVR